MKCFFLCLFGLASSFCFSQQVEEFRLVKNFYNHHRSLLNKEFKKKFDAETNMAGKAAIEKDFLLFISKMDSIENVALIGALLKVKNLEDINKIRNSGSAAEKVSEVSSATDKAADYPGGINALRKEVARIFYTGGVYAESKTVKTNVAFIVEKDGTVSNVQAQGDNFTFNRQAEIALYSISEKFSPALINGDPVRFRYQLPLTLNIKD
ncbi:energy transducer TonB [Chryseobacterium gossypii]|uniref:energy transducer TonB n=1 Tax=Chryseobacterium gossypii TaxID=3231602 RepID=UPI003523F76B